MRKALFSLLMSVFLVMGSSCAFMDNFKFPKHEPPDMPMTYGRYDNYVQSLRIATNRGEISATEAERLRQEAYREYLNYLKENTIEREALRNW